MDDGSDRVSVEDDDELRMQPPSGDADQSLPPQTLEESLRSMLRTALNALAVKDATILDLRNRLDESETARAELQTTVGRLEVRVDELDDSVQDWRGNALDAEGSLRDVEADRNALREERDRMVDDRRHETVRTLKNLF